MSGRRRSWPASRGVELVLAFGFLTRLPTPTLRDVEDVRQGDCLWAYPIVGLVVGAIGAGVLLGTCLIGLSLVVGAALALAAMTVVTGALHEDGLADFADGVGGGATREQKLEIMRDSRIGTYGALALMLSLILRIGALIAMPVAAGCAALIVAAVAGRVLLALPFRRLSPARTEGLGNAAGRPGLVNALTAVVLGALLAVAVVVGTSAYLLDEVTISVRGAAIVLTVAIIAVYAVCGIAWRALGGHTGDVFGAAEVAGEMAILVALSATWHG